MGVFLTFVKAPFSPPRSTVLEISSIAVCTSDLCFLWLHNIPRYQAHALYLYIPGRGGSQVAFYSCHHKYCPSEHPCTLPLLNLWEHLWEMHPVDNWVQGMHRLGSAKCKVALGSREKFWIPKAQGVEDDTFSPGRCYDSGTAFLLLK